MTLHAMVEKLCATRGHQAVFGPAIGQQPVGPVCNVVLHDHGYGTYILHWNHKALGPWPSESDGFSYLHLRGKQPVPVHEAAPPRHILVRLARRVRHWFRQRG